MLDESACPWHGDWYRKAIARCGIDEKDHFRLYYQDNCTHDDRAESSLDSQHQVDYVGTLHQALMDVAAWCEQGIEPLPTTNYTVSNGEVFLPDSAKERGGMQPVVHAYVKEPGCRKVVVKAGETVHFTACVEVPEGAGSVTFAAWDYEGTNDWSHGENLLPEEGYVRVETDHIFAKPGRYYPCMWSLLTQKCWQRKW